MADLWEGKFANVILTISYRGSTKRAKTGSRRAAATGLIEFKQLRAHVYPLWEHSGVLRTTLDACSDAESPIQVPVTVADEQEARHFEDMLWVLYHNTLPDPGSLELERALGILRAADKFAVAKVTKACTVWCTDWCSKHEVMDSKSALDFFALPEGLRERLPPPVLSKATTALCDGLFDVEAAMNSADARARLVQLPISAVVAFLEDERTSVAHESSIACLLINWAQAHKLATVPDELALCIRARYLDVLHMAALTEFFPQWTPQFIAHCAASQRQLEVPMHSNASKLDAHAAHAAVLSVYSAAAIYASLKTPRRAKSTVTAATFARTVKMEDVAAAFASAMDARATVYIGSHTPIENFYGGYYWCLDLEAFYRKDGSITLGAYVIQQSAVAAAASIPCLVGAKYTIKCLSQPGSADVCWTDSAFIRPCGLGLQDFFHATPKLTTWDASAFAQWTDPSQNTLSFEATVEML